MYCPIMIQTDPYWGVEFWEWDPKPELHIIPTLKRIKSLLPHETVCESVCNMHTIQYTNRYTDRTDQASLGEWLKKTRLLRKEMLIH